MREGRLIQKLKSGRGESLVELLASVLIGGLSVMLLAAVIMTSSHINDTAQKTDEDYYEHLSHAEAQDTAATEEGSAAPITGEVTVNADGLAISAKIPVTYYGGGGVYSYRKEPAPGWGGGAGP